MLFLLDSDTSFSDVFDWWLSFHNFVLKRCFYFLALFWSCVGNITGFFSIFSECWFDLHVDLVLNQQSAASSTALFNFAQNIRCIQRSSWWLCSDVPCHWAFRAECAGWLHHDCHPAHLRCNRHLPRVSGVVIGLLVAFIVLGAIVFFLFKRRDEQYAQHSAVPINQV